MSAPNHTITQMNGSRRNSVFTSHVQAEREVEILNHCFDDIELFMGKLQQAAEAHKPLNDKEDKTKKKSQKKKGDAAIAMQPWSPTEEEFIDIFQKIKYSFSLLARLRPFITNPAEELLHHIFVPLHLLVKTTGDPALGASVTSPTLTNSAIELLLNNLTTEEKQLWMDLGPNWTQLRSQLPDGIPTYTPVFLDGWIPELFDSDGQLWEDPVETQHKHDDMKQKLQRSLSTSVKPVVLPRDDMEAGSVPRERLYSCSYDFVARNCSELSVLQGETLEVIESSKRWWKCQNRFSEIGFVPFNILEPLSAVSDAQKDSNVVYRKPKQQDQLSPGTNKYFSYAAPNSAMHTDSPHHGARPLSMPVANSNKVMAMNDELQKRLANGKANASRSMVIQRAPNSSTLLNYQSSPPDVAKWLQEKGFSEPTVQCLSVLSGAQLFSLNKEELCAVTPEEGARIYSQVMVQKALLEDVRRATELEAVMEKQKMKVDLNMGSGKL